MRYIILHNQLGVNCFNTLYILKVQLLHYNFIIINVNIQLIKRFITTAIQQVCLLNNITWARNVWDLAVDNI